jgi:hypothetical protein
LGPVHYEISENGKKDNNRLKGYKKAVEEVEIDDIYVLIARLKLH